MDFNLIILAILSFVILFLVSKISYKLNLLDRPSKRKPHNKATAYTGGVALSLIYVFSIYLFGFNNIKLNLIFSIGFLIAIVGFIDDLYGLNVGGKLSLQIIPIFYLILFENFRLYGIGDYKFFILELNSFSVPFTLLSVILLINSFNYFDGMDGCLGFATISVLIILFFLINDVNTQLFLIVIMLPLLIFLIFNFSKFKLPKLFLGDSGSLLFGFIFSFTLIYLATEKNIHPILLAFSVSIFVYEFLAINLIRIIINKKLFNAGFDHLHHIIFYKTKSIILTNLFISSLNIIIFTIGYLIFKFLNEFCALLIFILLFIVYFILRKKISEI